MADNDLTKNANEKQVYTPGPWLLRFDGDDDGGHSEVRVCVRGHGGEECDVAEVSSTAPNSSAEFMANARLLAAAPDLLEALRLAPDLHAETCALHPRDFDAKCTCWVGLKRAALAKAEGAANG